MTGHLAYAGHHVVVFDAENGERGVADKNAHAVTLYGREVFATLRKRSVFVAPVEGHNFARAEGLDPQAVIDVISKSEAPGGRCWDTSSHFARLEGAGKGKA